MVSRKEVGTRPALRSVTYLYERQRFQLRLNALELRPTRNHRAGKLSLNHRPSFAVSVRWYVPLYATCARRKVAEPQWNLAESQLCFIRVTWSALPGWCTAAQLETTAWGGRLDADTDSTPASQKGSKGWKLCKTLVWNTVRGFRFQIVLSVSLLRWDHNCKQKGAGGLPRPRWNQGVSCLRFRQAEGSQVALARVSLLRSSFWLVITSNSKQLL